MVEMTRYCPDCGGGRLFEQHHAAEGGCPDSADGWCPEWLCTGCGAALFAGPAACPAGLTQAPGLLPGRRVA
jgi:hypothetical protein